MGEELTCAWCGRRYRLTGLERIEALNGKAASTVVTAKPAQAANATNANRAAAKRDHGPPGGVMPMIGFMVVFNALAIVTVSQLFLKNPDDGTRRAVWDEGFIVAAKSIWPEVAALLLGNLLGFAAWAVFAYRIHKKALAARKNLTA